jgi:hypothetical protein
VAGKITALDVAARELTLAASDGPLRVAFDRNTMVFLESRLGSLRDLAVGAPARVNVSGDENLAAWIELRPRGIAPTPGRSGGYMRAGALAVASAGAPPSRARPRSPRNRRIFAAGATNVSPGIGTSNA